jgi:GAF domain-containing protein
MLRIRLCHTGQPVIVSDAHTGGSDDEANYEVIPAELAIFSQFIIDYKAWLSVPLVVKGEVYGSIMMYYQEPRIFTNEEISLAKIFSDQVALAIENARLRIQAEQAAVIAERNRLARELHDAVSQTLIFSQPDRRGHSTFVG